MNLVLLGGIALTLIGIVVLTLGYTIYKKRDAGEALRVIGWCMFGFGSVTLLLYFFYL